MKRQTKNKQLDLAIFGENQSVYSDINIMQRHQMVNGLAKDVINKLGRETVTKQRETEIKRDGAEQGVNAALCAMIYILWKKWGKCNRKAQRLKVAFDIFNEVLENIENPTEEMLEAEAEFFKQTGAVMSREKAS